MLDTNNLGELAESADKPQEAVANPLRNLAARWRKKAIRFGSKDAGVLNDEADIIASIERPTGDPFGPTAPVAVTQGYNSGGRRSHFDPLPNGEPRDPKTGLRKGEEAEAFPYYEPDDEEIVWRFTMGNRR